MNTRKLEYTLILCSLVALTACSTTQRSGNTKSDPETVLVTYHVKPGKEAEFQTVLSNAWRIYRTGHLVFAQPHTVVRETEDHDKARFVEIFTWINRATPEQAPEAVKTVWQQEQSLCEARNGHGGIEGGEVELVTGR